MDVPSFNPAELSDEKLVERINQCRFNASHLQHQPGLLNSVHMILEALEAEHHERMTTRRLQEDQDRKKQESKSEVIEIGTISQPPES